MIAVSGLLLVVFLLAHLAGVGLAWLDPAAFECYAATLHAQGWLPPAELALAATALVHPLLSLRRVQANARARGAVAAPLVSRRGESEALAALAARTVPWSGSFLLVFLAVHLAQLRLHRPAPGMELAGVLTALATPWSQALYGLAGLALLLHLFHGVESAHRSLGFLDPANREPIRWAGRGLALTLGSGFALLPLALVLRGPL